MIKKRKKFFTSFMLYLLGSISCLSIIYSAFNKYVWLDEDYTLGLIRHSFNSIIRIDSYDVHPPLYYLFLKLFDFNHSLVLAKILSLIPFIILAFVISNFLKNIFGLHDSIFKLTAVDLLLLFSVPNIIGFSTEIRMYGWGVLFVTTAYLILGNFIISKKMSMKSWLWLTIIAVLSLYTNYFTFIHVAFIYLLILLFIFFERPKNVSHWLYSVLLVTVTSVPVLLFAYKQLRIQRSTNGTISGISFSNILKDALYPFVGRYTLLDGKLVLILSILCMIILGLIWCNLYVRFILDIRSKTKTEIAVSLLGPLLYIVALTLNIVMPIFLHKVVYSRYITLILGALLVSAIFTAKGLQISKTGKLVIKIGICVCVLLNSIIYVKVNYDENKEFTEYQSVIKKFGGNRLGFIDQDRQAYTTAVTFPNKKIELFYAGKLPPKDNLRTAYFKNLDNVYLKKAPIDTPLIIAQHSRLLGHEYKVISGPYYFMLNEPSPAYIYQRVNSK